MFKTEIEMLTEIIEVYGENTTLGELIANLKEQEELLGESIRI